MERDLYALRFERRSPFVTQASSEGDMKSRKRRRIPSMTRTPGCYSEDGEVNFVANSLEKPLTTPKHRNIRVESRPSTGLDNLAMIADQLINYEKSGDDLSRGSTLYGVPLGSPTLMRVNSVVPASSVSAKDIDISYSSAARPMSWVTPASPSERLTSPRMSAAKILSRIDPISPVTTYQPAQ